MNAAAGIQAWLDTAPNSERSGDFRAIRPERMRAYLARYVRAAAPVGPGSDKYPSGSLRRSVKARAGKQVGIAGIRDALVGPTSPVGHLVIPGTTARVAAVGAVLMPISFLIGIRFGAIGLAWAWLGAFPILTAITARLAGAPMGLRLVDVVRARAWGVPA